MKTVGDLRKTRHRSRDRAQKHAYIALLIRIERLAPTSA